MRTSNMILTDEGMTQFKGVIDMLNKSLLELIKIAEEMVPEKLIQYGLKDYLKELCGIWEEEAQVQITLFFSEGFHSSNEFLDTQIYRIIRTLVRKAFRDPKVTVLNISMIQEENLFIVRVSENGNSFVRAEDPELSVVKSMTENMGGTFRTDFGTQYRNTVHLVFEM